MEWKVLSLDQVKGQIIKELCEHTCISHVSHGLFETGSEFNSLLHSWPNYEKPKKVRVKRKDKL